MARFIALYLPQYHPTPENDVWWGKGFTEWVNVAKAKPLFRGHDEPRIPTDLGFYDLRLPEVREEQAALAKKAGIEAFCYWHYWFGNGKELLDRPFKEVVSSGKPDFPFCLAWANHSWYKKKWDPHAPGKDVLLIKQEYPGETDYIEHFYSLLDAFKDNRYLRVNNRLFFVVYSPSDFNDVSTFIRIWRELADKEGLGGFYFVAPDADSRNKDLYYALGFDAIYNSDTFNIHHHLGMVKKVLLYVERKVFHKPTVFQYKDAIKYMVTDDCADRKVFPCISPNWDHSPRSGSNAIILDNAKPEYFARIVRRALEIVKDKPKDEQIIIIKSWNEWGEGNYMEPDATYGQGYIEALRSEIEFDQSNNN